jgi:hypothetical protein
MLFGKKLPERPTEVRLASDAIRGAAGVINRREWGEVKGGNFSPGMGDGFTDGKSWWLLRGEPDWLAPRH